MLVLTKDNFEQEVLEAKGLVMVDFWMTTCRPCLAIMPEVEAFVERNEGKAKFCKIEVSENKRVAVTQKIFTVPSIVFYRDGEQLFVFNGQLLGELGMEGLQAKLDELTA